MKAQGLRLALALMLQASTTLAGKITDGLRLSYLDDYDLPTVPSYNISMPIDHFAESDTRTYNNRYFVNDTHYKPGGPVILYDFGEAGVDDWEASVIMAAWNGTESAPLELAKRLNGVVVGWEHRYYGYSHPFAVNEDDGYTEEGDVGIPVGGAKDFRYLTVEQSLEDIVYFANHFNQTTLGRGNKVLSGANATQSLDPWHTPWLWVGGSYPGMRGAWLRLRNPEIIYAVWASSAPVHTIPDGSAYPNSIYRALPKNCTADIHAAVTRIDDILTLGSKSAIRDLGDMITVAEYGPDYASYDYAARVSNSAAASYAYELSNLFLALIGNTQGRGYTTQLQLFCDVLESFDAPAFLANASLTSGSASARNSAFFYNDGGAQPSDKGIAATSGDEAALAAYLYAVYMYLNGPVGYSYKKKRSLRFASAPANSTGVVGGKPASLDQITPYQDMHSWEWQVLAEVGIIHNINGSSPMALGSKYANYTFSRELIMSQYFPSFDESDFPPQPDNTFTLGFGGWDMTPSNVMWTNGEFDPWRAYGVMSLEQDLGAPVRQVTQDVPKCGEAPAGTDVFGLLVSRYPSLPRVYVV
jgi:hypothetical protein